MPLNFYLFHMNNESIVIQSSLSIGLRASGYNNCKNCGGQGRKIGHLRTRGLKWAKAKKGRPLWMKWTSFVGGHKVFGCDLVQYFLC